MTGTCKLCNKVLVLRHSHIVPDFYIRGLEHELSTGTSGETQPFSIVMSARSDLEGGAKQRGFWEKILGIKEYLLCEVCERKFAENETYVRDLFYGNTPPPLKKLPIGSDYTDFPIQPNFEGFLGARKVVVDYKRLRLFQLSLLWRAGVAKGLFFKSVNLGEFHEAKLRNLLFTENPGLDTDYACTLVDLRHNGMDCAHWVENPKRSKEGGQVSYQLIVGGYLYLFTVSKQMPPAEAQLCSVKPSGVMIVLVADATEILRSKAATLRKLKRI